MTSKPNGNESVQRRVDELVSAVIEGRITATEQDELARLLSTHEVAQQAFLAQLEVEAMLRGREYRVGDATRSLSQTAPFVRPAAGRWRKFATVSLIAASCMFVAGLGLVRWFRVDETPNKVATIVGTHQAEWGDERGALLPNSGIGLGRLSLKSGTARLATAFDVELNLTAPCLVEFLDAKALQVYDGRVTAKVIGEAGVGFRITTPTIDLVDLGTEFGVLVEQDGSSEVHVFQGVVVARARGAEQVVPFIAMKPDASQPNRRPPAPTSE